MNTKSGKAKKAAEKKDNPVVADTTESPKKGKAKTYTKESNKKQM